MAKKLSELDPTSIMKSSDIISITIDNGGSYTSKKMTVGDFASEIVGIIDGTKSSSSSSQGDQYGEVVLVLSGRTVSGGEWAGLTNGVHYIDGNESIGSGYHRWTFGGGGTGTGVTGRLNLKATNLSGSGNYRSYARIFDNYNAFGSKNVVYFNDKAWTGSPNSPSIQDRLFTSFTFPSPGDGTVTWAKGANWNRGEMAYSNSSSSLSDSTIQLTTSSSSSPTISTSSSQDNQYGEVVMSISGMSGSNWNGLGNGVHYLDGNETNADYGQHRWAYQEGVQGDDLILRASTSGNFSRAYLYYNYAKYTPANFGSVLNTAPASIDDRLFTSVTLSGVTFLWSKGANWSRGNMGGSNSSSTVEVNSTSSQGFSSDSSQSGVSEIQAVVSGNWSNLNSGTYDLNGTEYLNTNASTGYHAWSYTGTSFKQLRLGDIRGNNPFTYPTGNWYGFWLESASGTAQNVLPAKTTGTPSIGSLYGPASVRLWTNTSPLRVSITLPSTGTVTISKGSDWSRGAM